MRKYVIVDYQDFFPITEAFERLGYRVLRSASQITDRELVDCDLALFCMFKSIKRPLQSWTTTQRLNAAGVPVITWNRDGPSHKGEKAWRLWTLRHFRFFNIYATHTLQDAEGFAPAILYLPNAAWDTEYHLGGVTLEMLRDPSRYKFDVSFFGRIAAARYPEMREREVFFQKLAPRLAALGIVHSFEDRSLSYSEQRTFIQTSRINLNYHAGCDANYHGGNEKGREKSWGMPERCFGVPACGGFLLSDSRKHAVDSFSAGTEWVDFFDLEDCIQKIRRYLSDFSASRAIAEAAYFRVVREHLYVHRAQTLVAAAEAWRQRGLIRNAE
jgi:spore maturation protein CgeB